ncbi:MAG: RnfABCDGE type electron transport complex subunit G [Pseudomonadota bacterium]
MREMINMVVVLTVLTAVSGFLLATVESSTKVMIEEQVLEKQKKPAIAQIFPEGSISNDPIKERFNIETDALKLQIFPAKLADGGKALAFETKGKGGYGGDVGLMVGINLENDQVIGVRVTTHSETPGLGARAKDDPEFVSQFTKLGMDTNFALKKESGVIDAMSGATITSRAVTMAALEAQKLYKALKPEIEKQIQ